MHDDKQALLPPPKVPFGGELAVRVTARIEPLLKPLYALVSMIALFALALTIGRGYPAVEVGAGGDFFPGHLYSAKLGFLVIALLVVAGSRGLTQYRDHIAASAGLAVYAVTLGWQATLLLLGWLLIAYYVLKLISQHLALVIVGVGIIVGAKFLPVPKYWGNNFFLALAALRVAYYAFERRYLRKRDVSLVRALSYVFSPLLLLGPDLVPYPAYFRAEPRAKTDRSAARLLYWAGIKLLLCALIIKVQHTVLPDPKHYDELVLPWKVFVAFSGLVAGWWLRVAVLFDLGAGFANFAGYPVPDAFEAPFFATTPFAWFRRHNVNVLNFYRRVAVLEVTRRFRGRVGFVLVLIAGSALNMFHHAFLFSVMSPAVPLAQHLLGLVPIALFPVLLIGYWMEKAYHRFWPLARFIFIPATLFTLALGALNPGNYWLGYGALGKAAGPRVDCFALSLLTGTRCTEPPLTVPDWVWSLVVPGVLGGATLLVVVLGRLVPAFRAPVDTRPRSGRKPAAVEL